MSVAVSRGFLQPLEGKQKAAIRLGRQSNPTYVKRYFNNSKEGRVPGINVCNMRRCGLAINKEKLCVRNSPDGIAFKISIESHAILLSASVDLALDLTAL